jgi:hypothetical protein
MIVGYENSQATPGTLWTFSVSLEAPMWYLASIRRITDYLPKLRFQSVDCMSLNCKRLMAVAASAELPGTW